MLSLDDIQTVFARRGGEQYAGEPVSQLEHALQTALLAEQDGGDDELVTACLLHDLGHLLNPQGLPFGSVRNPALNTQDTLQPIANSPHGGESAKAFQGVVAMLRTAAADKTSKVSLDDVKRQLAAAGDAG